MKIGSKDSAEFFMPSPCFFSTLALLFGDLTGSTSFGTSSPSCYEERICFANSAILSLRIHLSGLYFFQALSKSI